MAIIVQRLRAAVENYLGLLIASRNLDFFTSFYRYLIQLLPAAVVAPLFFQVCWCAVLGLDEGGGWVGGWARGRGLLGDVCVRGSGAACHTV